MHSYIFQISKNPISKENYLSADAAFERAERHACFACEVDDTKRREAINGLVSEWPPSGLFEGNEDGSFTYLGGYQKWVNDFFIPYVREAAKAMIADKIALSGLGSSYEVVKRIENRESS